MHQLKPTIPNLFASFLQAPIEAWGNNMSRGNAAWLGRRWHIQREVVVSGSNERMATNQVPHGNSHSFRELNKHCLAIHGRSAKITESNRFRAFFKPIHVDVSDILTMY
jgi:hypothetical protein